jgi:hypothetical protein
MPKKKPFNRLRKMTRQVYDRAAERVRRFTRQTDEVLSEEPIDFSAPSIPYYENLANRLSFTRVVLYMVLLVFVVVTVISNHRLITYENLYYLAKDISAATVTAQSQADQISYPISSSHADFALHRGGMVIAGSEVVTAVSGSGRQTLSVNVAYAEPCVRASDKYCLTFGRGERSFAVYNSFVQIYRESTEFPVYDAVVGDNGCFAIVTRSRDYTSEVIIYNDSMEKLANYHLNGYVTGISMNREGNRLGIVSVESVNGLWETKVTLIRMDHRISQSSAVLSGIFGSTCGFVDDERFAVVCSDRLIIWGTDATVKGETFFDEATPILCTISEGRIAILSKMNAAISEKVLQVFDKNGRSVYAIQMDASHPVQIAGNAVEMVFGGNTLYIRTVDKLFRLSDNGKNLYAAVISRDTLTVLATEDEALICTPAYAARLSHDDFTKE